MVAVYSVCSLPMLFESQSRYTSKMNMDETVSRKHVTKSMRYAKTTGPLLYSGNYYTVQGYDAMYFIEVCMLKLLHDRPQN